MRAFSFSLIFVLVAVFLLYMNYLLLGQFFFCLFLAQITSIALRPYIESVNTFCFNAVEKSDYLLSRSYVFLILKYIWKFITIVLFNRPQFWGFFTEIRQNLKAAYEDKKREREDQNMTIFNDQCTPRIVLMYLAVTRLGWESSLYLYLSYFLISFVLRIIATVLIYVVKKALYIDFCLFTNDKMTALRTSAKAFLIGLVPSIIVTIYGIFLLAILVFIFLLLKEDLSQLQNFLSHTFGVEKIILKFNVADFDKHFNFYVDQSIRYL